MTKFAMLGAAVLLSAISVTPVAAQEVISNPGYCAQFYPNANRQNKGAGFSPQPAFAAYQQPASNPGEAAKNLDAAGELCGSFAASAAFENPPRSAQRRTPRIPTPLLQLPVLYRMT